MFMRMRLKRQLSRYTVAVILRVPLLKPLYRKAIFIMKLKCENHDRRVLTIGNSFHHRTGDQSKCNGKSAYMGDKLRPYVIGVDGDIASHSDSNHPMNQPGNDSYVDSLV